MKSILITQCLQNDFVELIDKYDPIPNQLHVGYEEARRLLGEKAEEGPVNTLLEWAYDTSEDTLELVHIRDWHNPDDPAQKDHLEQFGAHCVQNTHGADFVFSRYRKAGRKESVVNASGLNDFYKTNLEEVLAPFVGLPVCKVGLVGVWTEAKVSFLAYELKTRYPNFQIGICSLVTASSSRSAHFIALEQLKNLLGIHIYTSLSEFTAFLNGTTPKLEKRIHAAGFADLKFEDGYSVSETDEKILQYLFRDAREVGFHCLDGGFSGNVVLKASAINKLGQTQVPTVIKIGEREPISKERMSFEKIQEVLGNSAPNIVDFAEMKNRGAIKYRYASMLDGDVKTFQKYFAQTGDTKKIEKILSTVFEKQLGRLYEASSRETVNLLKYYDFNPRYAQGVRSRVEGLLGYKPIEENIKIFTKEAPNVCFFYEVDLHSVSETELPRFVSYLHGDLNGANIIVDAQENVWLIDFFHTHKGHILKDLIKLENDILYIFTKIETESDWLEASRVVEALISVSDLRHGINPNVISDLQNPEIQKSLSVISYLRSLYANLIELDRDPYQLWVGLMRYAMHTISFEECNDYQKKLALYAGCLLSKKIKDSLSQSRKLRIDYIPVGEKKIGLTILPGRKDRGRDLEEDLGEIQSEGIENVLSVVTEAELEEYGVKNLFDKYREFEIESHILPVLDQGVPTKDLALKELQWIDSILAKKDKILVHCVGGLGRSGTLVSLYLIWKLGLSPEQAIAKVREGRSPRAIESKLQEEFIYGFAGAV